MINTEGLMIGNWVFNNKKSKAIRVDGLTEKAIISNGEIIPEDDVDCIYLSQEIFPKMGFKKNVDGIYVKELGHNVVITYNFDTELLCVQKYFSGEIILKQYVERLHELQQVVYVAIERFGWHKTTFFNFDIN